MAGELIRKCNFHSSGNLHLLIALPKDYYVLSISLFCVFQLFDIVVKVLDACSAPGNKTVHLAALMKGKGKIIACELDEKRVERLKYTVSLAGASSIL